METIDRTDWAGLVARIHSLPFDRFATTLGYRRDVTDMARWKRPGSVLSINGEHYFDYLAGNGGGGAISLVMHAGGGGSHDVGQISETLFNSIALRMVEFGARDLSDRPLADRLGKADCAPARAKVSRKISRQPIWNQTGQHPTMRSHMSTQPVVKSRRKHITRPKTIKLEIRAFRASDRKEHTLSFGSAPPATCAPIS